MYEARRCLLIVATMPDLRCTQMTHWLSLAGDSLQGRHTMQGSSADDMQTYRAAAQHRAQSQCETQPQLNMQDCLSHKVQGLLAAWQGQRHNVALMHLAYDRVMHATN